MSEPPIPEKEELTEKMQSTSSKEHIANDSNISMEISEDIDLVVKSTFPEQGSHAHDLLVNTMTSIVEKAAKAHTDKSLPLIRQKLKDVDKKRYKILDKLRINCVNLAAYHNNRYHLYKNMLFTCFRVPLIVLSGLNSFFSVGLQSYMDQRYISLINALISLFCGILTSVELLLNLQKRMEVEMECGKEYYKLSVEIYTELSKSPEDRGEKGDLGKYLGEKHNVYQTLHARGNAVNLSERGFIDEFELYLDTDVEISSSDGDSDNPRPQRAGSHQVPSTLCPGCLRHTCRSCLSLLFYCCTSEEKWMEDFHGQKNREKSHMLITRGHSHTFRMSGDLNNMV